MPNKFPASTAVMQHINQERERQSLYSLCLYASRSPKMTALSVERTMLPRDFQTLLAHFNILIMRGVWISFWLLASANSVLSKAWDKTPLTTVTPCPAAAASLAPPAITVTSQNQAVSTCEPHTAYIKRQYSTQSLYDTYSYVSTVIPCLAASSTTTTVTGTEQ